MHGYQMIQELSRRSGGAWTPSPGSIYPTLQLLEDEGLVTSHQSADGKRMFEITDAGRAEAAKFGSTAGQRPWEQSGHGRGGMPVDLVSAIRDTAITLVHVATSGTDEQRAQVVSLLADFRQKLSDVVPGAPIAGDPRGPWGAGGRPRGNWSRSGPGWSFGVPNWLFGGQGGGPFGPGGIWGSNTSEDVAPWESAAGDDGERRIRRSRQRRARRRRGLTPPGVAKRVRASRRLWSWRQEASTARIRPPQPRQPRAAFTCITISDERLRGAEALADRRRTATSRAASAARARYLASGV